MRQSGILAAAGLYALDHNVERLAEDHANARLIGEALADSDATELDLDRLETNILVFRVADAERTVARAREREVLVSAFGPHTIRAVTHLDVDRAACEEAAAVLVDAAEAAG
jgi:threonine aldolase